MIRLIYSLLSIICIIASGYAQERKEIKASCTIEPIEIDGELKEMCWSTATTATNFLQYSPYNGAKPSEKTHVKFVYDDNALYVGAYMEDSKPNLISKNLGKRDEFNLADYFGVYIDSYDDASKAFAFFVTAAGVQIDMKSTTDDDYRWNAVWESAVKHMPNGWVVEMKIPYSALRFSKAEKQKWGLNMKRVLQRNRETTTWNFVDINKDGMNKQSGLLTGIENIEPPIRLAFIPYVSAYLENEDRQNSYSLKGGMDVKYGINESFTLDMMLIPDFGQVMSDKEVLNLGPFETYYDENREFFKEGMELFSRAELFYSRRIGATPENANHVADIADSLNAKIIENPSTTQLINATKITGKTRNGINIGFLNALSQRAYATVKDTLWGKKYDITTQEFTNYNVSVIEKSLPNNSFISLINTNLYQPETNYTANATGARVRYEIREQIAINGSAALSQKYDLDNSFGYKYWAEILRIAGKFRYKLYHNTESKTFNPNDMGYLQTPDKRNFRLTLSYALREPFWKMLNWYNEIHISYNTMFDLSKFVDTQIRFSSRATTKQNISLGLKSDIKPIRGYNYHEPRVDGYKLKDASWQNISAWISTDYRKPLALDVSYGRWSANQFRQSGMWYSISPRVRIGNRFQFVYDFNGNNNFNAIGYVTNNSAKDTIVFGQRNYQKIENNININYVFTPTSSLMFYLRHYWTKVDYNKYYTLNKDGTLNDYPHYNNKADINYNAFNIDVVYTWQFAPGSEMSLVWKNQILSETDEVINSFRENLEQTFSDLGKNSISIRVLYYIDYLQIKNMLL